MLYRYGLSLEFKMYKLSPQTILFFSLGSHALTILTFAPETIILVIVVNIVGTNENVYFYIASSVAAFLS